MNTSKDGRHIHGNDGIKVHSFLVALIACLFSYGSFRLYGGGDTPQDDGNNSSYHPKAEDIIRAISGATGSALSMTLLYPLETVRTRLQVGAPTANHAWYLSSLWLVYDIGRREGIGLYRGWSSLVVALMALNFVYFYCFHVSRRWVTFFYLEGNWIVNGMRSSSERIITNAGDTERSSVNKVAVDLVAGYFSGCMAALVTGPLWLVNTRLKLQGVKIGQSGGEGVQPPEISNQQQYKGIVHCLRRISEEEGVLTLWHGTFTSIILAMNPAIQLGVYEMLKRHHLITRRTLNIDDESGGSGPIEVFVNAIIAKFIATLITYPIQVLQTRHRAGMKRDGAGAQAQAQPNGRKSRHWALLHLYRGLESKLLQTCLNSALMFVAYERLVSLLTNLLLVTYNGEG